LLLAVVCVLANYSNQVFDGFFTQFDHDQVLPLKVKEPPRHSRYYSDLPVFASGSGITYDITISHEENLVYLPSYRGGLCVVSIGKMLTKPKEHFLSALYGLELKLEKGIVYPTQELAEKLSCQREDKILIGGSEYKVGDIIRTSGADYSFFIYDPDITADEYIVILSDNDQLLDVTRYLNSDNFSDTEGILALCEGYRAMKMAMNIVLLLLAAVCAAYIFVFIKMYFSKREEFVADLLVLGMRKSGLFMCMSAVFAVLIVIGSALGLWISVLLDMLVDMWAKELLKMSVDKVNYLAYFAAGAAACLAAAVISLLINIKKSSDSEVRNR
ncbi:MAG: hypothetical protein K2N56_00710, partial [Oscillospiraceae bacterium]|nr:hypothetical protein [Oscillospiraceae bacterium]